MIAASAHEFVPFAICAVCCRPPEEHQHSDPDPTEETP